MPNENLLLDPLIRTVFNDGRRAALSLPQVLAAYAADRVASHPGLRAHQAPAWHAFLVQVAVMGCEALDRGEPPGDDPDDWARVLRALTPDWPDDEPWRLVTPPDKPAFFQPPVPGGSLDAFKKDEIRAPDALDLLVTSKNHDLKAERIARPQPDDWIFALVSLQTQEGQMGAGNYGIARMNGGYGSRSFMQLAPAGGPGARLIRDVRALRDEAWEPSTLIGTRAAIPLAWVPPWDGGDQFDLANLHPLFVECCRRVRLVAVGERLVARVAGSSRARTAAKEMNGALGDPWAPIDTTDGAKAFSVTSEGFSYRKVVELLFSGGRRTYQRPYLAGRRAPDGPGDMRYLFAALARGQGKTEGFHTRSVVAPAPALGWIDDTAGIAAALAHTRVAQAGETWGKALRPALFMLFQGGPDDPDWRNPATGRLVDAWRAAFDDRVDQVFFPELWAALDRDPEAAARDWARTLAAIAHDVFTEAKKSAPRRAERRFLAEARADDLLANALRKTLPALRPAKEDEHAA